MNRQSILFSLLSFAFIFSSCLGDEGQRIGIGPQAAVLDLNGTPTMYIGGKEITNKINRVYASKLESINGETGDCYMIEFVLDFGADENQNVAENQYYTVENLEATPVNKWGVAKVSKLDTVDTRKNEILLTTIQSRHDYIRDILFLYTTHAIPDSMMDKRVIDYEMSFLDIQEPTTNPPVYELFLRTTQREKASSDNKLTTPDISAYNLTTFVNTFINQTPDDTLRFTIVYPKTFNQDTTAISSWSTSETFKLIKVQY
ncbi:MAG: hypothetical protein LUG51_13035 [Tannerellaceae bacterium]|nr:hypothetical protein [Tannerellaceae bacterium]